MLLFRCFWIRWDALRPILWALVLPIVGTLSATRSAAPVLP